MRFLLIWDDNPILMASSLKAIFTNDNGFSLSLAQEPKHRNKLIHQRQKGRDKLAFTEGKIHTSVMKSGVKINVRIYVVCLSCQV